MLTKASALVTTEWLHNVMKSGDPKDIRILDSSFHLPSSNRNGRKEYEEKHIPGALYFDIKECCDKSSPYGLMLPDTKRFEQYVGNLGIDNSTHIVVYDNGVNYGFFSAPRIWWMFRVFGHEMVSVLDGGFMKWCSEGLPTTSEVVQVPKTIFDGIYHPHLVKSYEDIVKNLKDNSFQLMDARGGGQFMGIKPEAREGLTACCIAFAAYLCGKEDVPVYDGSWPEWYLRSTPDMRFCPSDKKEATCMIC
ncbi:thiosulfate sulfurtransferase-like isoform X3 [Mytilus trossulus]|uniref:thiosulfate sulfurtransferase-like isoform X3 n=1 Tax=Mytilus trossulus TaxID=6551 RepID=UPI00300491CD